MKNTGRADWAVLALDCLCAGLLALGAALVVLPALGLPPAPWMNAVGVLLGLALCCLEERRPWLLPAAAGALLLGVLLVLGLTDTWEAFWAWLGACLAQAAADILAGEPRFVVCAGAALPLGAVFWLVVRKLCRLWPTALLAAGLIGYQALCRPGDWLAPFLLLMGGMILFLPRARVRGAGLAQAQLLALALAAPVLGLSLLIGPGSSGQWRSAAVGHLVQDCQDLWEYRWGDLPALPLTSMRGMGLQPQKDRLGGDLTLGNSPVLTCNQELLLRGQALEVYTGTGWEDVSPRENGNFRYDSLFWLGRREEAFGTDLPRAVSVPLLEDLLTPVDAELRTQRNFRSLFVPYRTEEIQVSRGGGEVFFNMQGEAYWRDQPQASMEYRVRGRAWAFRRADFDKNMELLEQALAGMGEDPAYGAVAGRCLQLPESLPWEVRELALSLTAGESSPYGKAAALRDYLREHCEYTLTPGDSASGQDFVAGFLREGRGYCTYYASALTVLCRCAGVPARYVTGYGMVEAGRRWQATQATAHAWTEIYIAHAGWVPLDALGQEIFRQEEAPPEDPAGDGAPMGAPATPPPSHAPAGELYPPEEPDGSGPLALLWGLPAVAAALMLPVGKALRRRRYRPGYVRRRFPESPRAAEHLYAGLLRLLGLAGLAPRPGETLLAFWNRAADQLPPQPGLDWREPGRILDRLRFGGRPPTPQEITGLCRTYQALGACLRRQLPWWKRARL